MDWKDMLASLKSDADPEETANDVPETMDEPCGQKEKLRIVLDKKGRKGKTATIIEGFTISDEAVADVAAELKRRLGTGGSARGGEILLQGDWREKAKSILESLGFRV